MLFFVKKNRQVKAAKISLFIYFTQKGIHMIKRALFAATLTLSAASAQAELIEYDWENQGDGAVSLDTQTGNLWLDLKITSNKSINEVKYLIQNDARFSGWRLPTLNEVYELAGNIFNIDPNLVHSESKAISEADKAEHSLMNSYSDNYVYGIYEKDGGTYLFGSGANGLFLNYAFNRYHLDYRRIYEGVYLVSNDYSISYDNANIEARMNSSVSDVSAPAALGAFGLMLGFAGMRKRKS